MPRIAGIDKSGTPVGIVSSIAYDSALPAGTLLCDGSSVSQTAYPILYAAIGTKWGTAGAGFFNLPDLRGKFIRGRDHGAGNDPDVGSRTAQDSGGETGDNVGSVQGHQLVSHTHNTGTLCPAAWTSAADLAAFPNNVTTPLKTVDIGYTGGNETRPINAYCNYVIAYL
jgi:microcystin-dependent protein